MARVERRGWPKPPRYTGPTWIGKRITPTRPIDTILTQSGLMPVERGPEWIGRRLPVHPPYRRGDKPQQII